MSSTAIKIVNLGKMYRLYRRPVDKVLDAFGLAFWKKNFYQEFWALREFSLEVKKGERLGIIGRNGAGKSTLLKIIAGNITPTEGVVTVSGRIQALMELGTGFHPEFTGRQNIRATLAYQGYTKEQIDEKEIDIIDFSELEDFIDNPVRTYSAGMYARLAFSAATSIEPEILIIDEVLGAGDAYFTGKCVERMRKLTDHSGVTVIFVSHDLNSVQQLCDRIIWIDRGRIKENGDPLYVLKAYTSVVRKEEQIRLRARDLKVLKKQAVMLDRNEDIYQPLLFHFITEDGKPAGKNRIYSIRLLTGDEEICAIELGKPLDNSPDQLNYIMDNSGYMDWGPPRRDKNGTYREYLDLRSKFGHAPFELSVPLSYINEEYDLVLEIMADIESNNIAVELFNNDKYIRMCDLNAGGFTKYAFKVPSPNSLIEDKSGIKEESDNQNQTCRACSNGKENEISQYGSREASINKVWMMDQHGEETKIFETGKPMRVAIDFTSNIDMKCPVFVFCIYLPDGKCASQWIADSSMYGEKELIKSGRITFSIDRLLLGKGSYVASAAMFKRLSGDGMEAESYHVLDRCIHFQIVQKLGDNIERGLCLQPYKVEFANG